jgi:hypothetical protein
MTIVSMSLLFYINNSSYIYCFTFTYLSYRAFINGSLSRGLYRPLYPLYTFLSLEVPSAPPDDYLLDVFYFARRRRNVSFTVRFPDKYYALS